jgi:phosphoserine phosphatase RsbU/P
VPKPIASPEQSVNANRRGGGDGLALKQLFKPFYRGAIRPSMQGLGLGLFIASEIARAHDGTLTVASSDTETRFTFRMPTG